MLGRVLSRGKSLPRVCGRRFSLQKLYENVNEAEYPALNKLE